MGKTRCEVDWVLGACTWNSRCWVLFFLISVFTALAFRILIQMRLGVYTGLWCLNLPDVDTFWHNFFKLVPCQAQTRISLRYVVGLKLLFFDTFSDRVAVLGGLLCTAFSSTDKIYLFRGLRHGLICFNWVLGVASVFKRKHKDVLELKLTWFDSSYNWRGQTYVIQFLCSEMTPIWMLVETACRDLLVWPCAPVAHNFLIICSWAAQRLEVIDLS